MSQPHPPAPAPAEPGLIAITRGELLWLTIGMWIGGVFILAMLPALLIPRLGLPWGIIAAYAIFFVAWQPLQNITQRTLGRRAAFVRMIVFVAGAATVAFYLREAMLAGLRTN
jgi:hypothetical protein